MGGDERQLGRGRHHHPHPVGELLDPLGRGELRDVRPVGLVGALQFGHEVHGATDRRAELERLHLHEHDSRQQHPEHRDPQAPADQAVKPAAVGEPQDQPADPARKRDARRRVRLERPLGPGQPHAARRAGGRT